MNSFKSHITLILSLIFILFSFFLFKTFSDILNRYQKNIINNYSITVVSEKPIKNLHLTNVEKIEPINVSEYIKKLQKSFHNIDFKKIKFPYFYSIKLKKLPNPEELNHMENYLKSLPFIKRVLTYRSSQTKIYNLLFLLKLLSNVFMILVGILGFLLIIKQLEVWKYQHRERMYIMELFGAPFWFKGAALFKIAFTDSFISFLITLALIFYLTKTSVFFELMKDLSIDYTVNLKTVALELFCISFGISLFFSIIVVIGKR